MAARNHEKPTAPCLRELALREKTASIGVDRVKGLHVAREKVLVFAELVREQNLAKGNTSAGWGEAVERERRNRAGYAVCVEC